MVYNRFGQIVHAQSNYDYQNTLWDGTTNTADNKELNDGVYYYTLDLFNTCFVFVLVQNWSNNAN